MMTFVKATFVLATFDHIRNISANIEPILSKLFGPNFFRGPNYFGPEFCWNYTLLTKLFFKLIVKRKKVKLKSKSIKKKENLAKL